MSDRRDFDRLFGEVDAVLRQPVDHRPGRGAQLGFAAVLEGKPRAAVRRAATGLNLLDDRVGGEVARDDVSAAFADAIIVQELLAPAIEQPAAQLVAKRIPHDGIHADEARREVTDGKELHELHVDELGARGKAERITVATHVG